LAGKLHLDGVAIDGICIRDNMRAGYAQTWLNQEARANRLAFKV
jgi:hypothetical protein